jgi:hypothetical protein
MPSKLESQTGHRGRGRPKGARNKFTIEREKVRSLLENSEIGPTEVTGPRKDSKEILIDTANYFWNRAMWLSDRARKLANEEADRVSIQAIMKEANDQLLLAAKCAHMHAQVSDGVRDSAAVSFVARLPSPMTTEQWAEEYSPDRLKSQNGSH